MSAAHRDLSLDDTFQILSASRRRGVISALLALGEDVAKSDVTDYVAEIERSEADGDEEYDTTIRKRVQISLRQTHYPKLDDYGVIDYDRDGETVRKGPNFDAVVEKSFAEMPSGGVA